MMIEEGKWQFLHNDANKQELIKFVASYVTQEKKYRFKLPLIITFAYINNEMEEIFIGNHEEADTRLILHALLSKNDVVMMLFQDKNRHARGIESIPSDMIVTYTCAILDYHWDCKAWTPINF